MPSPSLRIVITGVSRGLGAALVEPFTARGHVVLGCAREGTRIAELARRFPGPHEFSVVDVRDARAVAAWATRLVAARGAPDLVLNNAAVIHAPAPLWELDPDEFADLMDVNVDGVFHVARAFLPAMIAAGRGVLVNLSSGWGRSVAAEMSAYCASKWAVEGLTRALAEELPPGMAAVPLNPGIIRTDMLERCFGSMAASYPSAEQWALRAVPQILALGPRDNGEPRSIA